VFHYSSLVWAYPFVAKAFARFRRRERNISADKIDNGCMDRRPRVAENDGRGILNYEPCMIQALGDLAGKQLIFFAE